MVCPDYDSRFSFRTRFNGSEMDVILYMDDVNGMIHLVIEGLLAIGISSHDIEFDSMDIHEKISESGFETWLFTCVHDHTVNEFTIVHGFFSLKYSTLSSRWTIIFKGRIVIEGKLPVVSGMEETTNLYYLLSSPILRQAVISYFIL
jgi:hypothetical protein